MGVGQGGSAGQGRVWEVLVGQGAGGPYGAGGLVDPRDGVRAGSWGLQCEWTHGRVFWDLAHFVSPGSGRTTTWLCDWNEVGVGVGVELE